MGRFARSFAVLAVLSSSLVKEVAYGEDLRWFRRSVVKEGLYGESRKPFTDRKAPFAEQGREDAARFFEEVKARFTKSQVKML